MNESVRTALDALRANPLRTTLSTLGIVIGVAGLAAVLSLGAGMERSARAAIQRTTDVHDVVVTPRATTRLDDGSEVLNPHALAFSPTDAADLGRRVRALGGAAILRMGHTEIRRPAGQGIPLKLIATVPDFGALSGVSLVAGHFLPEREASSGGASDRPVVLSEDVARRLEPRASPASLLGARVLLRDSAFTVVGIADSASGPTAVVRLADADVAMLPTTTPSVARLLVVARRVEDVPAIADSARAWLTASHPDWHGNADVATMTARVDQLSKAFLVFQLCMGAIAGISLLVGGIGIMNVLLAAVAERTREIGIRKAVGARNRDVRGQFLAESVLIAVSGSAIGLALGLSTASGVALVIRRLTANARLVPGFSWPSVVVPVVAAAAVGLVFGLYPAWRAGAMSPIDAIRHE